MMMMSEFYSYQGQVKFDDTLLKRAVLLNPQNDRALYKLSDVQLRRQRNPEASLKTIDKFIQLYPYHISGLLNKAERHYQLGQLDLAQSTVDKILNFYPSFQKARRLNQVIQRKKISIRRRNGNA